MGPVHKQFWQQLDKKKKTVKLKYWLIFLKKHLTSK